MRQDLEAEALGQFADISRRLGFTPYRGQGSANRIGEVGRNYLQFGDLRVETPSRSVIVEVESAGGVGNLVKYWYLLAGGIIDRAITLAHVFRQLSESDYAAHFAVWDFLANRMTSELGERFMTRRFNYRALSDLDPALTYFESAILESKAHA